MKKLLAVTAVIFMSGCYSTSPQQININNSVKSSNSSSSNSEMKFSFSLKDAQSASRVKSIDAYLVKNYDSPLLTTSNVYSNGYKYQANVVNGIINITFNNYPLGQNYYLAIQAFDDIVTSSTRNNITAIDSTVISGNNQVARSNNSVSYTNGSLVYSDLSSTLNISINLLEYNNLPVNLTPQNGSNTPNSDISLG